MSKMDIHQRIREHRIRQGLTEQGLADKVGVTRAAVQQWERPGGTAPARRYHAVVADALGLTVAELVAGSQKSDVAANRYPDLSQDAQVLGRVFDWIKDEAARNVYREKITREVLDLLAKNPALGAPPEASRTSRPTRKRSAPATAKTQTL